MTRACNDNNACCCGIHNLATMVAPCCPVHTKATWERRATGERRGTGHDPYAHYSPDSFRLAEMGEEECYGHVRSGSDRRASPAPSGARGAEGSTALSGEEGPPHRDADWNEVEAANGERPADLQALTNVVADLMEFAIMDGRKLEEIERRVFPERWTAAASPPPANETVGARGAGNTPSVEDRRDTSRPVSEREGGAAWDLALKSQSSADGGAGETGERGTLVERLVARWVTFAAGWPTPGEIPTAADADFWIHAIADELWTTYGEHQAAAVLRTEIDR